MSKRFESLVNTYKYWLNKYIMSARVNDLHKKTLVFKELMEEANNQGISREILDKLLGL